MNGVLYLIGFIIIDGAGMQFRLAQAFALPSVDIGVGHSEYHEYDHSHQITHFSAHYKWRFIYGNGGTRPTRIHYDVYQNGTKILGEIFNN